MTGYMIRPNKENHPMNPATLNSLKAGAWTALFSFLTLFGLSLIGWLNDLIVWASGNGADNFPPLTTLGYATVVAIASAAIGFVNFVVRAIQGNTSLPGGPPQYPGTPT